jgi:hypothetical protein
MRRFGGYIYSRLWGMITCVVFEVNTVIWIQIVVLWAAALCIMQAVCQCFGGTNCLHLQDRIRISPKRWECSQNITRHNNSEYHSLVLYDAQYC